MAWPVAIEDVSWPRISGMVSRPETVGEYPRAICMYWLRNTVVPNSTTPTAALAMIARVTVRLRKRSSGMIGAATRDSTQTAIARTTTEPPTIAVVCQEAQSNEFPANVTQRRSVEMPADMSSAPQ